MKSKLSIVTVCFNEKQGIVRTIEAIDLLNETLETFEWIVVDGASSDGTLELIRSRSDIVDMLIVGKDSGLFNAMNIGLSFATGEYVWFLNGGDGVQSIDTRQFLSSLSMDMDYYYGSNVVFYPTSEAQRLRVPSKVSNWKKGIPFSHQSFILKKSICEKFGFDEKPSIAADTKLIFQVLEGGFKGAYINGFIVRTEAEGLSDIKRVEGIHEHINILEEMNELSIGLSVFYRFRILRERLRTIVMKFLPKNFYRFIYG